VGEGDAARITVMISARVTRIALATHQAQIASMMNSSA
jgi:hypothetical protein